MRLTSHLLFASSFIILAAACSIDTSVFSDSPSGGATGTSSGTATGTATGTASGTTTGTATGTDTGTDTGTPSGTMTGTEGGTPTGGACVEVGNSTNLRNLYIMVMVDRSGSMQGANKFGTQVNELAEFAYTPVPEGTLMGINWHPSPSGDICSVASYNPIDAAPVPIPSQAMQVDMTLGSQFFTGASPMATVLEGTLAAATAQQSLSPEAVVIAVLIMDSVPTACNMDINFIAGLAAQALASHGVRTHTIALESTPSPLDALNSIAAAGGTQGAVDLTGAGAAVFIEEEMNEIRSRAVPCELPLPETPGGIMFDADEVNLEMFTPGPSTVPRVNGAASCGDDGPGWYWDDPTDPTVLKLCPATCADQKAFGIDAVVLFGCPSQTG